MKAWLYYRLSRDKDEEMNSLQNQRQILIDYAERNGYEVVGESFDDNVSGMPFNRKGLAELENAVDEGKIDVISVTEGFDTTNENDDLLIGFKQIFNEFYNPLLKTLNKTNGSTRTFPCNNVPYLSKRDTEFLSYIIEASFPPSVFCEHIPAGKYGYKPMRQSVCAYFIILIIMKKY